MSQNLPLVNRSQYITFAKGFSILTIVLYHYFKDLELPGSILKAINLGGGGVHLFIFASGFGLALSKSTDFKTYFNNRFSKVLIPYFIAVTFIFLLNLVLNLYPNSIDAYLSHIFLYKMFVEKYVSSYGVQFWFISTIIQFYLVFPLLLRIIKKYSSIVCIIAAFIISMGYALGISALGIGQYRIVNSFFLQYLWEFVLGIVVAKEGIINRFTSVRWFYVLLISLVSYAIMGILVMKFGTFGRNVNDVFSFLGYLSFSVFMYKVIRRFQFGFKLIMAIEPISYSLFLTHYFVYEIFNQLIFKGLSPLKIPLVFIAAIIFAIGFNYLIMLIMQQGRKKNNLALTA